jgi:hypothetical protein
MSTHRTVEAEQPRTTAPGRRDQVVGALLGAVLGGVVCWLMQGALGDDALITLSYARTLAESGTWGVFPGITANTQTSPLNAWLLAAGILVVHQPVLVACGLAVLCLAGCGWLAVALARRVDVAPAGGWLAVAVIATSPVLTATIGLEAYLGAAVLLGLALAALGGRAVSTGVLCGLAVLTRPDLAVPAAVLALGLLVAPAPAPRRHAAPARPPRRVLALVGAVGLAAVVALPWHAWSWFHLGGAVPDTTWVRTGDRSGPTILPAVPGYLEAFPIATAGSAVPVALAVVAAVVAASRPRRPWARAVLLLVVAGWAHLLALELIGAQGAGWYFGPVVAGELGALAYYAAPVEILDFLSEPARTDEVMRERAAEGGLRADLMRLNALHRQTAPPISTRWSLDFVDPAAAEGRVVRVWPVESPSGRPATLVLTDRR